MHNRPEDLANEDLIARLAAIEWLQVKALAIALASNPRGRQALEEIERVTSAPLEGADIAASSDVGLLVAAHLGRQLRDVRKLFDALTTPKT